MREGRAGMAFELGGKAKISILYAFDGVNTPVGKTDVNDMSFIMMLEHGEHRVLFTGDLNNKIGGWLAAEAENIQADILKVPHHGTESAAPNVFFEKVAPSFALVPAPEHLWLSERSARIRSWFTDNAIPVYVNGINGNIQVVFLEKGYKITAENKAVPTSK